MNALAEARILGDYGGQNFMKGVCVRNTFLDISDDDPWVVGTNNDLRRQQTDSILHQNSNFRDEFAKPFTGGTLQAQLPAFLPLPGGIGINQEALPRAEEVDEGVEDAEEHSDEQEALEQELLQESAPNQPFCEMPTNSGVNGCTTVMMRQVPLKYTQRKLLREINSSGFMGQYDFLYLPMDPRSHANRGFAFINLTSVRSAEEFHKKFHGQYLRNFTSDKPIDVLPADLQGFEANALQYAETSQRGKRTGHTKPLFFRPLPRHIAAKLNDAKPAAPPSAPPAPPAPPAQRNLPGVTDRLPEQVSRFSNQATYDLVATVLQQALLPTMMKASSESVHRVEQERSVMRGEQVPSFCAYCGKKRLPDHRFCAYCGRGFDA